MISAAIIPQQEGNWARGDTLPYGYLEHLATAQEMRRMDQNAVETFGLPVRLLMEHAARAVADRVESLARALPKSGPIVVCCGPGNNGGDGLATARILKSRGFAVSVIQVGEPKGAEVLENLASWRKFGVTHVVTPQSPATRPPISAETEAAEAKLNQAVVLVDAWFGTGLTRAVGAPFAEWIARFNATPAQLKVAIDLPSGIHGDTGQVLGIAARCTHTVMLQARKPGGLQWPGAEYCGETVLADISVPPHWAPDVPPTYLLTKGFARALLPQRRPDGHKGIFGHVLTVCGSAGMGGAALLATRAALKSGAGLVTAAVPGVLRDAFLGVVPEAMTLSVGEPFATHFAPEHLETICAAAADRSAVVLGCGLGRYPETQAFAREAVRRVGQPMLIDADGLNALEATALCKRTGPTVITPHPGELARLCGTSATEINIDRIGQARTLAEEWGVVLVLKGAAAVVADPSGEVFLSSVADHALATGGSGDVLSGIIGSLMAQGLAPLAAALLGVYLHTDARTHRAELAGAFFSASDLIDGLNGALIALGAD